jgi:hypothetical protein
MNASRLINPKSRRIRHIGHFPVRDPDGVNVKIEKMANPNRRLPSRCSYIYSSLTAYQTRTQYRSWIPVPLLLGKDKPESCVR